MSKIAITHAELIELAKEGVVSAPCNGTEGEIFEGAWCDTCKKDKGHREDPDNNPGCITLIDEFMDKSTGRWKRVSSGRYGGRLVCLDFVHENTPDAPYRCDKTIDMFPGEGGE